MQHLARLAKVSLARSKRFEDSLPAGTICARNRELNSCSNRITITVYALQSYREIMVIAWSLIPHESQSGAGAIAKPQIKITIVIPIDRCDGTTIIDQIESTHDRQIGKFFSPHVEKTTVPLVAAERLPIP